MPHRCHHEFHGKLELTESPEVGEMCVKCKLPPLAGPASGREAAFEAMVRSVDRSPLRLADRIRPMRREASARYRKWWIDRSIPAIPTDAIVPLEATRDVILLCSRLVRYFDPQIYIAELAIAHEMVARDRVFALSADPSTLFDKAIIWFLPNQFIFPRLWDYSRQVYEFAASLERQGNRLFCSSAEIIYWENKTYMHQKLGEIGAPMPRTKILTAQNWRSVEFDSEPALIKEEHSAGSSGVHHFERAADAREFVRNHPFRPTESLIMQEIVRGATKDMRLTMVGDTMIESASFWRIKSAEGLASPEWTTTATKYNSLVDHGNIPVRIVPIVAEYLRKLGIRTAGIDLMWIDDDVSGEPLVLELSPYYQPNPRKPKRYEHWTYKQYKQKPFINEGYFSQQYSVFRDIAAQILDQGLF